MQTTSRNYILRLYHWFELPSPVSHAHFQLQERIKTKTCILDGELLVYDTLTGQYEDFGGLKSLGISYLFLTCHNIGM